MRCVLPKSGRRISTARNALCNATESISARRRTRRSPRRCSASPSTRHPRREPRPSSESCSETFSGSRDITHLHGFCREPRPHISQVFLRRLSVRQKRTAEILRRRYPGGCSSSPGDRRRARRDVRLRASSQRWTPGASTSSRRAKGSRNRGGLRVLFVTQNTVTTLLELICYKKLYPFSILAHLMLCGRGSEEECPHGPA